ncbi:hypothetical protein MCOR02_003088 [Pyricularia oryzae]|uniref:Uncharacterized protein n=1 Tax=Pyricularia oryzae TaxID=318829 RepID=A0A4P7N6G9_PYROR|nr:hypothetical protein MCOR01_008866 [Pyricularia oryzae]KAH9439539.1 hypothetical protein MCOR02_003088 [Pyricularia oryzae]KAI6253446.1 hypothetical protein MCOR19_009986 [Pyricularia oryzae]KAI6310919.1 hypothetical protein MCOR29_008472 [Pyricularia oryzae]KAI6346819.1 hypothetical protein MCOR28_002726 [Pyricularia oryzae]
MVGAPGAILLWPVSSGAPCPFFFLSRLETLELELDRTTVDATQERDYSRQAAGGPVYSNVGRVMRVGGLIDERLSSCQLSILGFTEPPGWVSCASLGNVPTYSVHTTPTVPGSWVYHVDTASNSSPETKTDIAGIRVLDRRARPDPMELNPSFDESFAERLSGDIELYMGIRMGMGI